MKTLKNLLAMVVLSVPMVLLANCGPQEKFITADKLPAAAREFLTKHYALDNVASVKKDHGEYEVILKDGTDIDFNRSGNLENIEAPRGGVLPASLMSEIPAQIAEYLKTAYPDKGVTSIDVEAKHYKVELEGMDKDLIFNKQGAYVGMED